MHRNVNIIICGLSTKRSWSLVFSLCRLKHACTSILVQVGRAVHCLLPSAPSRHRIARREPSIMQNAGCTLCIKYFNISCICAQKQYVDFKSIRDCPSKGRSDVRVKRENTRDQELLVLKPHIIILTLRCKKRHF